MINNITSKENSANNDSTVRFSYEFFPPRNAKMTRRLWRTMGQLERLNPSFFSMTYGALGSEQQISIDTAVEMHGESSVPVAAHLTCANASAQEIDRVIQQFYGRGIRRIVALRGDVSDDQNSAVSTDAYHSVPELIEAINKIGSLI